MQVIKFSMELRFLHYGFVWLMGWTLETITYRPIILFRPKASHCLIWVKLSPTWPLPGYASQIKEPLKLKIRRYNYRKIHIQIWRSWCSSNPVPFYLIAIVKLWAYSFLWGHGQKFPLHISSSLRPDISFNTGRRDQTLEGKTKSECSLIRGTMVWLAEVGWISERELSKWLLFIGGGSLTLSFYW